jgi:hypothetical protein
LFGRDETIATWFNIDMEMYTDESNKLRFALLATNENHFSSTQLPPQVPSIRVLSYVTIDLVKAKLSTARVIFLCDLIQVASE